MQSEDLAVFVDGIANYFNSTTEHEASVGTPFLSKEVNSFISDFTGIIGISGNRKGSIFFSAPKYMLVHVLSGMGLISSKDAKLMDLVGEICNTVSGNARREFGEDFNISVPITIQGKPEEMGVSEVANIYVIPIEWQQQRANLIVNLEES
ncbi:hypothetical protein NBRC116583_28550 [Arenicella sp. 4NH20-0111]|uniref:chemotaxis protein CheX n=1 Tax=Arenicella sp. 4NH20-0111 TaxID=3127648 RepID=UPI00310633CC